MKTVYVVTMPDGSEWAVPVMVIARNRAEHYAHEYEGLVEDRIAQSLREDTIPLFESDPYEIHDWAANNMNWEDVQRYAVRLTGAAPPDYQEGWVNGAYRLIDEV